MEFFIGLHELEIGFGKHFWFVLKEKAFGSSWGNVVTAVCSLSKVEPTTIRPIVGFSRK